MRGRDPHVDEYSASSVIVNRSRAAFDGATMSTYHTPTDVPVLDSERLSVRAMAGNAPRRRWHSRQRRPFEICKLQNLKDA